MSKRRAFLRSAVGIGSGATLATMAGAAAAPPGRTAVPGGIRLGELYFASGATGVRPERRKDPSVPPGDIGEQTERILERHKKNLEALGSSLENVLKVTVFLADPKNDRTGMNAAYAKFFPKDAPARSAIGVQFPDDATKVEIELIAWIPAK
jgi:2-iminobutanoate/2-iminopropanoate deaminase